MAESPAWLTVAINIVLMSATFWAAWSAHQALKRKPEILIYLRPSERYLQVIEVVFANVGSAAVRDFQVRSYVAVEIENAKELEEKHVRIPGLNAVSKLSGLPANNEIAFPLGTAPELFAIRHIWPVTITVDVRNMAGRQLEPSTFRVDPRELEGIYRIGDSALNEIAKSVMQMQRDFARCVTGDGRLKTEAVIETVASRDAKTKKWLEAVQKVSEDEGRKNAG